MYRIVGNFWGRKLSWIPRFCCSKGCHAPKFRGEFFCKQPQNHEIRESLLPQKFPAIR